jgi:hypothetical protein
MNTRATRAFATQIVLGSLVALGAGGGLGFAIVDLRHDISVSANTTRVLDQRIAETERRVAEIGGLVAADQSPEVLEQRNQTLALGLVAPAEARVVRVGISVTDRLAANRKAEIFAAETGQNLVPVRFNLGGAPR